MVSLSIWNFTPAVKLHFVEDWSTIVLTNKQKFLKRLNDNVGPKLPKLAFSWSPSVSAALNNNSPQRNQGRPRRRLYDDMP